MSVLGDQLRATLDSPDPATVAKAADFIDDFADALGDGWALLQKRGEGYPPPEFVYRGDLYTYQLVE